MAKKERATLINICVFTATSKAKAFTYNASGEMTGVNDGELTDTERAAFYAAEYSRTELNAPIPVNVWICPFDYELNIQDINAQGFNALPARLPGVLMTAYYPDGTQAQIAIKNNPTTQWGQKTVYPKLRALYLQDFGSEQSIICQFLPVLCNVGAYVWLAAAGLATLKAMEAQDNKPALKIGYTAGALLAWDAFFKGGGLKALSHTNGPAAVGKLYDDITIQPGSRVDEYWRKVQPQLNKTGVEEHKMPYLYNVGAAIKHFRLYSIEFGNWMSQQDRSNFLYGTMVTLRDMSQVLGVSQDRMGLKGKLSLAFGSRGKGGFVAAFYQHYYVVISLTKTMGRGSFCHEYAHAVDYALGLGSDGRSRRRQPNYQGLKKDSIKWLFEKVFDIILWNEDGTPSSYQGFLDKATPYYNTRVEIWARICETYFTTAFNEAGIKNTWGVSGTYDRDLPRPELVRKAAPYIKNIFSHI